MSHMKFPPETDPLLMERARDDLPTPEELRVASNLGRPVTGRGRSLFWWAVGGFGVIFFLILLTFLRLYLR